MSGTKLNAFAHIWELDGDYIRCRVCKRPQQVSYALWDFPHRSRCKNETAERNPWLTLNSLIAAQVAHAKPPEEPGAAMSDQPQRIQRSRAKGSRLPDNTVCVTRPGPWGNPFVVGRDGTAAECVYLYRRLLDGYVCLTVKATTEDQRAAQRQMMDHLDDLKGKNLACFCGIGKPCHADTLLELASAR